MYLSTLMPNKGPFSILLYLMLMIQLKAGMKNQIFIYLVLVLFVNISFSGVYKFLPGKLKQFNSYVILGDVEEETNKEESASGELDEEYILANNIIPTLDFTTQSHNSCNEGEDPSRISLEKETPPPEEI